MKINIEEIQQITVLLLSKLKESIGNEVEIANDYYWDIANDEIYDPYIEPKNLTLGQLSFDIKNLQEIFKNSNEGVAYHLKLLSNILKSLSIEQDTLL